MNENERAERSRSGAWLQALMLREPGRWSSRLAALWLRLRSMGRGQRRRLGRVAAGTLAGASGIALMALLAGPMSPPVAAAGEIIVGNSGCTSLVDAIKAVQTNTTINSCNGTGTNTIILAKNVTFNSGPYTHDGGGTALPIITDTVIIESSAGNKFAIERNSSSANKFRLIGVKGPGNLTLRNVIVRNGDLWTAGIMPPGGCIHLERTIVPVTYQTIPAVATIEGSTIDNCRGGDGGGIYLDDGRLTISDSTISNNSASNEGGGLMGDASRSIITATNVIISGNTAEDEGGGIYMDDGAKLLLYGSVISGNVAGSNKVYPDNFGHGGGVYTDYGVIEDTLIINNTAYGNAGGLYSNGDKNNAAGYTLYVDNTVIIGNRTLQPTNSSDTSRCSGGGVRLDDDKQRFTNVVIMNNTSVCDGGGIYVGWTGNFRLLNSTIVGNSALGTATHTTKYNDGGEGGGIFFKRRGNSNQKHEIINTTISGNTAADRGGGISSLHGYFNVTLAHVTVSDNYAKNGGGGISSTLLYSKYYNYTGVTTVTNSIISGNRVGASASGVEVMFTPNPTPTITAPMVNGGQNVLGSAAVTSAQAFSGFTPGVSDVNASSDDDNHALSDIIESLEPGGPDVIDGYTQMSHALPSGSPALDLVSSDLDWASDIDQLFYSRPYGEDYDAGAREYLPPPPSGAFISTWTPGTIISGSETLTYNQLDILAWDGEEWTKWFDGLDAGLNPDAYKPNSRWKHNINAMSISDTETVQVFMSFTQNDEPVPDIPGRVDGMDVVLWDGDAGEEGEWSLIFNGNLKPIGLNNKTQEKIDGLHVMAEAPDWSEFSGNNCEAYMLISTQGPGIVPKPGNVKPKNVLKFGGEDVLGFCATNLGINTTGFWEMVLDGSAEGVGRNNIDSISLSEDGSMLYLTSKKAFNVDGAFGGHSMVFAFDMADEYPDERGSADGDFSGPYLRFMDDLGIQPKVDALHINGELELP